MPVAEYNTRHHSSPNNSHYPSGSISGDDDEHHHHHRYNTRYQEKYEQEHPDSDCSSIDDNDTNHRFTKKNMNNRNDEPSVYQVYYCDKQQRDYYYHAETNTVHWHAPNVSLWGTKDDNEEDVDDDKNPPVVTRSGSGSGGCGWWFLVLVALVSAQTYTLWGDVIYQQTWQRWQPASPRQLQLQQWTDQFWDYLTQLDLPLPKEYWGWNQEQQDDGSSDAPLNTDTVDDISQQDVERLHQQVAQTLTQHLPICEESSSNNSWDHDVLIPGEWSKILEGGNCIDIPSYDISDYTSSLLEDINKIVQELEETDDDDDDDDDDKQDSWIHQLWGTIQQAKTQAKEKRRARREEGHAHSLDETLIMDE